MRARAEPSRARPVTSTGSCRRSPIRETRPPPSPSDPCTATDRTPTASPSTPRRAPPSTGASNQTWWRPGECITSAATGQLIAGVPPLAPAADDPPQVARYIEDSGTSMSAAHVSGAIAAFLSVRTRIHRPTGIGQKAVLRLRDRPGTPRVLPGCRPDRPDAGPVQYLVRGEDDHDRYQRIGLLRGRFQRRRHTQHRQRRR